MQSGSFLYIYTVFMGAALLLQGSAFFAFYLEKAPAPLAMQPPSQMISAPVR